ncbi:MAG: TRAP transporter small permease [Rhodospirillaceae bacterium]|jgi:TRAP-type C4-dicarboxylate transport system permease small subunit|nr:TRAP transporter small permease [Rhodospirillaceae bacterium]MBT7267865.1 TRAP transporter small permease [Rhodospirillaceae bacterium]
MTHPATGTLQNLNERVTLWLARAGCIGLAAMMFLTLFDVIGRAFGHPIAVSVEATELIMGMMIYLGIGYTTFMRGHIRVDILIINMSARTQAVLDFITGCVGLLIAVLISWRLWLQAISRHGNNDLTQIAEVPVWPYAFIMAFACMLMVTSLLFHLYTTGRMAFGIDEAVVPEAAPSSE